MSGFRRYRLYAQIEALSNVASVLQVNFALLRKAEAHGPEIYHFQSARVRLHAIWVRPQLDPRRDCLTSDF